MRSQDSCALPIPDNHFVCLFSVWKMFVCCCFGKIRTLDLSSDHFITAQGGSLMCLLSVVWEFDPRKWESVVTGDKACHLPHPFSMLLEPILKILWLPYNERCFISFSLFLFLYKDNQVDIIDVMVSGCNFKAMQNTDSLLVGTNWVESKPGIMTTPSLQS